MAHILTRGQTSARDGRGTLTAAWQPLSRGGGTKRLLQVATVLLLVVLLVFAGRAVLDRVGRMTLGDALAAVPGDARRVSFTDWAAVREQVGAALGDAPAREAVEQLIADTYATDLSAASAVDGAAGARCRSCSASAPARRGWEVYGQSESGAALTFAVPDDTDFDQLADNLRSSGYSPPEEDDGVWLGGVDVVASLDPTLSPLAGLAMGLTPSSALRVVGHYEDADGAEADVEARAALAVGEAYGSGSFSDDYELTRVRTVDSDVVLDLEPSREGVLARSNVYHGPVVFAGC